MRAKDRARNAALL